MIKVRELVNNDPELLGNNDIMKFVKLALFRASEDEPVQEIAKELDDELSGYLVKTDFKLVFLPIKKGVPVMSLLLLADPTGLLHLLLVLLLVTTKVPSSSLLAWGCF